MARINKQECLKLISDSGISRKKQRQIFLIPMCMCERTWTFFYVFHVCVHKHRCVCKHVCVCMCL